MNSRDNDPSDPKNLEVSDHEYLTDEFAKRLPYSLAVAFWDSRLLVQGWHETCESIDCDNISADFAIGFFWMEKLLFGAAGLARILGDEELSSDDESEHGAIMAVNYVADEFAAVAEGVARWKFLREPSVHQLVVTACRAWLTSIQMSLDVTGKRTSRSPRYRVATLERHSNMLKKIMLGDYYLIRLSALSALIKV